MMIPAVGVRGLGAVTGYGWGVDRLWKGLSSGRTAGLAHSGLGGRFPDPCWIVRVPDEGDASAGMTRYAQAYSAAADEAIADAMARGWRPGPRVGVVSATTRADLELMRRRVTDFETLDMRKAYVQQSWTTPAFQVMHRHGFHGPAVIVSAACSSGLHALTTAQRLLALGDATDVLVVAADVGHDGEEIRLFNAIGPLQYDVSPDDACRPLQSGSRGFVIGEGVAALVLSAVNKNDYLTVASTALGNDAHHAVGIEPSHRHILETVDLALGMADVAPSEVALYVAHATGTAECARADEAVLRHLGPQVWAYGTKPLIGHCIAAANLLDTLILSIGYQERYVPVISPRPGAEFHDQLAVGPTVDVPETTVQLGLGFGGNISVAVYSSPTAG